MNTDHWFDLFRKMRIAVVGDVMLDKYLIGEADRISPEAPVPVVHVLETQCRLGGAANVGMNIKAFDATPILFSVTGADHDAHCLFELAKKNKISCEHIIQDAKRTTTVKTRILSKNHQMLRYDQEMIDLLSKETEKEFIRRITAFLNKQKINALIFEDYNKGVLTNEVIEKVISLCIKKKIPVLVDPKKNQFFSYKNCTVFKPNLRELKEALHSEISPDINSLEKAVIDLQKKLPHEITVITLADKGLFYFTNKKAHHIPAHVRTIADVSGAGDTVIATIAVAMSANLSLHETLQLANLAGGLVCEESGVVPVNGERLIKESNELK
jgi:D-glycero-beta-D-manno-heptose-7-phosphate kinase